MPDEGHDVQRDALGQDGVAIGREVWEDLIRLQGAEEAGGVLLDGWLGVRNGGVEREAAVTDYDGGDPLRDLLGPIRMAEDCEVVVTVGIDEAGGEEPAVGVDSCGRVAFVVHLDGLDSSRSDGYIGHESGRPRAV